MSTPENAAAGLLSLSATGFAALAAEKLLARDPEIFARFGEAAFREWKDHLAGRLQELASALRASSPEEFARQAVWARRSFEARGVDVADLTAALECLRAVVMEEMPPAFAPLTDPYFDAATEQMAAEGDDEPSPLQLEKDTGKLAARFLERLLSGKKDEALGLVMGAVEEKKVSVKQAYLDVVLPALEEVGRMWHRNEVNIAEEHFVTATSKRLMTHLAQCAERAPACGKTVITAAVEGNVHGIAPQVVADFFEMDGWSTIHLGADIPGPDLAQTVEAFGADLVALSATLPIQRTSVAACIAAIRSLCPEVKILVGGAAFRVADGLWRDAGADGCADDLDEAIRVGRELVGIPSSAS